jgi:sugar lactone lactonase YvrE
LSRHRPTWDAEPVTAPGAELGESPVWDAGAGRLLWLDVTRRVLHAYDPRTATDEAVELANTVSAIGLRGAGGMVGAVPTGFALLDADGGVEHLADIAHGRADGAMNDGACDPAGRFLAGSTTASGAPGASALYSLDPHRRVTTLVTGVTESNGVDWSPDGRTMYYVDTGAGRIDAFDYDVDSGAVSRRRLLATYGAGRGLPDGLTVDAEGCIWIGVWDGGRVDRLAPDGREIGVVRVPTARPTSCAFGGDGLDVLYITSAARGRRTTRDRHAGCLFGVRPGATGRAPYLYAG